MPEPIKDGGQALDPTTGLLNLTVRDYFAAAALAGILGCGDMLRSLRDEAGVEKINPSLIARCAYVQADAMLVAREVTP